MRKVSKRTYILSCEKPKLLSGTSFDLCRGQLDEVHHTTLVYSYKESFASCQHMVHEITT